MNQKYPTKQLSYLFCSIFCCSLALPGAPIVIPPSLNPGDTYRLVFVTSTARDASSSDIADYNTFVTGVALGVSQLAALNTQWYTLASTTGTNVLANTGLSALDTTTPFYGTNGLLVATGVTVPVSGLYGGQNTSHPSAINFDEQQIGSNALVWTGTLENANTFGALGTTFPLYGQTATVGLTFTDFRTDPNSIAKSFYAVSDLLTVPGRNTVPEPATFALLGLGVAAMIFRRPKSR